VTARLPADELPGSIEGVLPGLVERHRAGAREWYPHEYAAGARKVGVAAPVASALVVNLLTEDNLPYYTAELERRLGRDTGWHEWTRQWTAEEQRHGIALREWIHATGAVDPYELERARMATLLHGVDDHGRTLSGALVYVAVQELATRTAHRRTGDLLEDRAGREMLRQVSSDENRHFLFYRDLVGHLFAVDPSTTMAAVAEEVRAFAMPGVSIPGFREHAQAIAAARIYDLEIHLDHVVGPLLRWWRVGDVIGLDDDGEQARASLTHTLARLRRVASWGRRGRGAPSLPTMAG
jgi:acyl-[acyl-carrier-protein] desaturase